LKKERVLTLLIILYVGVTLISRGETLNIVKFVDFNTIFVIAALLLVSRGMELSGAFTKLSMKLMSASKESPKYLAMMLAAASAATASVVMNDTALFIFIPLTMTVSRMCGVELACLAPLVTIAVNVGSALTPMGNPQNIIIWQHYRVAFHVFIASLAPFTLIALAILMMYIYLVLEGAARFKPLPKPPAVKLSKKLLIASIILLVIDVALAQYRLSAVALILTAAALLLVRKEVVVTVDYVLIAMFILMFADFRGLASILAPAMSGLAVTSSVTEIFMSFALSQVVSNVPATLFLIGHVSSWESLAVGTNLGGVGLITGSLANIITIRLAGISIKEFHKYVLPYFAALLIVVLMLAAAGLYPH